MRIIFMQANAIHFCQMIRNACKSVNIVLRIIRIHNCAIRLANFHCATTCPCITLQFHSAVQVKQLNETAINSIKLTDNTFLSCIIIKMLISLKHDLHINILIANQFKKYNSQLAVQLRIPV